MTGDTLAGLEAFFARFPIAVGGPATAAEADEVGSWLGRALPSDYREFLMRYGGAVVGAYPIYGVRQIELMGTGQLLVTDVNEEFRRKGWPHVSEWLIVSEDLAGNPIGIADDGRVLVWDHDLRQIFELARSFEEFLRKQLEKVG